MKKKLTAKKISILYRNVKNSFCKVTLDNCFTKITEKFRMGTDLRTLAIGISSHEDETQTVRIYFYFTRRKHIIRPRHYFSFILDHPCEGYTSINQIKELELIMSMTTSKC